jgi:hypothetical protein
MAVVTAAIDFSDPGLATAVAERMAADATRYPDLLTEGLVDAGFAAARHLSPRRAAAVGRLTLSRPDATTVVVGGPARTHAEGLSIAAELASPGSASASLPYGRWIAMRVDERARTVRVLNDPLGMAWLYVASVTNGFLLSTDLAALCAAFPDELTVDEDAVLAQLATGYVPSNATCLRQVTMLPPGSVVEFAPSGMSVLSTARLPYGDRNAGMSRDDKFDKLDALLADALSGWCQGSLDDSVISLSGGHDSPFALAGMLMLGARPKSITWGKESSRDVRVPRKLSEALDFPWTHVSAPRSTWQSWQTTLQGVGAVGSDWAGWAHDWLSQLATHATGALTGNAGEALTGKNIREPDDGPNGDWVAKWVARSYQDRWLNSPLLRPPANRRLPEATREHYERLLDGVDVAFAHQRSLQLDLYGRQRRLTGGQTNEMARYLAPLTFFNSRDMVEFWVNVPWSDFNQQALYLDYATARHARVFDTVLAERDADASRGNAARRISRSARLKVAGRFPQLRDRVATTSNDLMGNQLRFKAELQSLLKRVSPLLDPIIDTDAMNAEMARFPQTQSLSPFRLANLLGVAAHVDLAVRRSDSRSEP